MSVATIEMHRRRLILITALLIAFGVLVIMRLLELQVIKHDEMVQMAVAMHSKTTIIEPNRGTIYDRHGRVLAISLRDDEVAGDPDYYRSQRASEQSHIIDTTAKILNVPAEQVRSALENGSGHYVKLKEGVTLAVTKAFESANISPAVVVVPKVRRFYPSHALLAHTLGFLNRQGQGVGLEASYNKDLTGVPGQKLFEGDNYGQGLSKVPAITKAQNGSDITLTIDINVQYRAERELENALFAERTMTGSVIVMDPRTGEILAMAGRPTYDPNVYANVPTSVFNNPVLTEAFEPGSIFKILTMAAALDTGRVTPTSTFIDGGIMYYQHIYVTNRNKEPHGKITPAQIMQFSSNVGIVQVADVLSTTAFYTYTHGAFGIGVPTGIDLPGENPGVIRLPGDPWWSPSDLATHSYGQGLTVTPIQMMAAVGAVANKGIMMRPFVVEKVQGAADSAGGPSPLRRVIKAESAAALTDMLVSVVETTVQQARVPGYHLAGKTGTALIPPPLGNYDENQTIASFIGYGPVEDPCFLILVRIDLPKVHQLGAEVAAPVFKNIAQWLLAYYKIPPSDQTAQQ